MLLALQPAPRLELATDARLEAEALAVLLAAPPAEPTPLQREALNQLRALRQLPAVQLTRQALAAGEQPAELARVSLRPDGPWRLALNELASAAQPWLQQHQASYAQARQELLRDFDVTPLALQEAWHRRRFRSYRLYYSPLRPIGEQFQLSLGQQNLVVIGPVLDSDGQATFADSERLFYLQLREFGHGFCDPVADRLSPTPSAALREQLVRAVAARLLRRLYGPEAYERHLQGEARQGFGAVRRWADGLADYEALPPPATLLDYLPQLRRLLNQGTSASSPRLGSRARAYWKSLKAAG